jgi:drug/metabolite transporter superfamily protein YnfA
MSKSPEAVGAMLRLISLLTLAAVLEVGGDALTRIGLQHRWCLIVCGAFTLASYGVVVNLCGLDFGRLMGAYIAVFFVVSQVIALALSRELPSPGVIIGGLLIVSGGVALLA